MGRTKCLVVRNGKCTMNKRFIIRIDKFPSKLHLKITLENAQNSYGSAGLAIECEDGKPVRMVS